MTSKLLCNDLFDFVPLMLFFFLRVNTLLVNTQISACVPVCAHESAGLNG